MKIRFLCALSLVASAGLSAQTFDVTSTGLNSTPIGATTPSTAAFTTLSASGITQIGAYATNRGVPLAVRTGTAGTYAFAVSRAGSDVESLVVSDDGSDNTLLGSNNGALLLGTWYNGAFTERSRINHDGLAVIGGLSSTSSYNLGNGGTGGGDLHVSLNGGSASGGTAYMQFGRNSANWGIVGLQSVYDNTSNNLLLYASSGNSITLFPNATLGATFSSTGLTVTGSVTASAYYTASDERLKDNIRNVTDSGSVVDALKPREFDWKTGGKNSYGFLAQELYPVAPYAVAKGDDNPDAIAQQWGVDYAKLVPVLTAEIKSLRARLAAVESGEAGAARSGETTARELDELKREVADLKAAAAR